MSAYWGAVFRHSAAALYDVGFVAGLSLAPLMLGRLVASLQGNPAVADYWAFLTNGQLAFFSMGSIATLLLLCFKSKLPKRSLPWFGTFALVCLLFLIALVGVDPKLETAASMVGRGALYLYIVVFIVRILAEAVKSVETSDAIAAGDAKSRETSDALKLRMSGERA